VVRLLEHHVAWNVYNQNGELLVKVARRALNLDVMRMLHEAAKDSQWAIIQASGIRHEDGNDLTRAERGATLMAIVHPSAVSVDLDMEYHIKQHTSDWQHS
jgi:hypothetical protein